MNPRALLLALLASACAGGPSARGGAARTAPAPGTSPSSATPQRVNGPGLAARRPVVREYFGTKVTDDYAWLEEDEDPEVSAFTAKQNAFARAHLDKLPSRAKIALRVAALEKAASSDWSSVRYGGGRLFALEDDGVKEQRTLVVLGSDADPKTARTIVDPAKLDPSGRTTIDFFVPSPDRKLVAVSLSRNGTESGDVHLFDVAKGTEVGEIVTRVHGGTAGGSLAWNREGSGFYYTRYPRAGERPEAELDFHQEVWFHALGTSERSDVYSLGKELPRIAEVELERSDDGSAILAVVSNGDGGEVEHHVLSGGGASAKWRRLSRFEDGLSVARFAPDGKVYAISRKDALRGALVSFVPPFEASPERVLSEGEAVLEDVVVTKDAIYVVELVDGPSRVRRVPLSPKAEPLAQEKPKPRPRPKSTKKRGASAPAVTAPPVTIAPGERGPVAAELPLPPVSSVSAVVRVGDDLLLRVESFVEPPAWFRYVAAEHRLVKTPLAKKLSFDMSDVTVARETCTSKDGTKVPMTLLYKRGLALRGDAPTLITGYGGFAISKKPRLRPWYRAWLEQEGVVVETNLRGGAERGEAWHRAGMLENKQNVFDDFTACARALVDRGVTRPSRLAAWGRSNGGLLMGAALTQQPGLFRAIASGVGLYDMLRSETTANGQFNVTEYGSVTNEAQFRSLLGYSPLHAVRDGVAYPAVLFTTGENDPRVDPFQSRKMVARLQAATSSDRPILLRTSAGTGHGSGTPLSARVEETADMLAFLFAELGVAFR